MFSTAMLIWWKHLPVSHDCNVVFHLLVLVQLLELTSPCPPLPAEKHTHFTLSVTWPRKWLWLVRANPTQLHNERRRQFCLTEWRKTRLKKPWELWWLILKVTFKRKKRPNSSNPKIPSVWFLDSGEYPRSVPRNPSPCILPSPGSFIALRSVANCC